MEKLKSNFLKIAIIPAFIVCMVILVGCSTSTNNTLNNISSNMNTIINTIEKVDSISSKELIIDDFMDENNISEIDQSNSFNTNYESTPAMNMYLSKLTILNNSIYHTNNTNNEVNTKKIELISKAHKVKSLSNQCKFMKCNVSDSNLDALEELNNIVISNVNRVNTTKNEVKNNLNLVNDLKKHYNEKLQQLSSIYQKLESSLNTRLSYYKNIINGLENISNILLNYNSDCVMLEELDENKNLVKTSTNEDSVYEHNKMYRKKNIDTYENAGKDIYGFNKDKSTYNKDGYYNSNYYPQYYNPYYGYGNRVGYGGYGIGMPYGYGMGMPYGYGGFMYPNINTFGTYKNIDTYKPMPTHKLPNQENLIEENKTKSSEENASYEKNKQTSVDIKSQKPKPKFLENGKTTHEEKRKHAPRPIILEDKPQKAIHRKKDIDNVDNDTKLEISTDLNEDDGEDKFVSAIPNNKTTQF